MSEAHVHREQAVARIAELIALLRSASDASAAAIAAECEALSRAITAFHMEGIRFRMYNVDRLLRAQASAPPGSSALLEQVRSHLESAGFHTRSHQGPV
jgi:hypothetical protein